VRSHASRPNGTATFAVFVEIIRVSGLRYYIAYAVNSNDLNGITIIPWINFKMLEKWSAWNYWYKKSSMYYACTTIDSNIIISIT